ncbi:MAG: phage antirepressor KilAC domain-containing protein [Bacteroidaceae bacterium]|nr:phage antirepressor KilAC domain-containing protein [Bacteroidaceae bacterium]
METGIQVFRNIQFGQIRVLADNQGEPLFCLKDLCAALSLDGKYVRCRLERGVVSKHPLTTKGGVQELTFVTEAGFYDVILESRKPEARSFRKWVTSEVLPTIRKQGGYLYANENEDADVIMARALNLANDKIQQLNLLVDELAPKAEYTDEVLDSVSCLTTTQIAKELEMSAIELNRKLCSMGIQYGQSGQYMLYADYARRGYAQNRTRKHTDAYGTVTTKTQLVWTERGKNFIHSLFGR